MYLNNITNALLEKPLYFGLVINYFQVQFLHQPYLTYIYILHDIPKTKGLKFQLGK